MQAMRIAIGAIKMRRAIFRQCVNYDRHIDMRTSHKPLGNFNEANQIQMVSQLVHSTLRLSPHLSVALVVAVSFVSRLFHGQSQLIDHRLLSV